MFTPHAFTALSPTLSAATLAQVPAETATRLKTGRHPVRHVTTAPASAKSGTAGKTI
jgi:hypothetical protein